jgi:hypothetical protein
VEEAEPRQEERPVVDPEPEREQARRRPLSFGTRCVFSSILPW